MTSVIRVFASFLLLSTCALSSRLPQVPTDESSTVVGSFRGFLNDWLLRRNAADAQKWFSERAYTNPHLFAGCDFDSDPPTTVARRRQVTSFLRTFVPATSSPQRDLHTVLREWSEDPNPLVQDIMADLGGRTINDVKSDGFIAARLSPRDVPLLGIDEDELQTMLPEVFYGLLVPVHGAYVHFYWIPENSGWRIYHAGMPCNI